MSTATRQVIPGLDQMKLVAGDELLGRPVAELTTREAAIRYVIHQRRIMLRVASDTPDEDGDREDTADMLDLIEHHPQMHLFWNAGEARDQIVPLYLAGVRTLAKDEKLRACVCGFPIVGEAQRPTW